MSRRVALALVLLAATALFALPLTRGEVFTFRDHTDYFQPLRHYTAHHLRAQRLPLWNPYSASGEPWLANPQTGVFYPPAWIFLVIPFERAYMLYLLAHLALLGGGAFALFSRFARPGAAAVGAVALMFCGPTLSMLDVQNNLATLAWLPWVVLSAFRAGQTSQPISFRDKLRRLSPAAQLAMSFLAGEPFLAALGAIVFALIVRRPREIAITAAGSIGIAAVQLFPFLELLAVSDRRDGFHAGDILRESMHLRDWLRLAVRPRFEGEAFDSALSQHYVPVIYIGVTVSLLAVIGIIALVRRRAWGDLAGWSSVVAVAILIASGPRFIAELPVALLRYPARVLPLAAFAIIAFAVHGLDRLSGGRWIDPAIALVAALELLAASEPLLITRPFRRDVVPFASWIGRDAKILRLARDPRHLATDRASWIAGYLNLYDRRYDAWTAAPVTLSRYAAEYRHALERPEVARAIGVGYVLTTSRLPGEGLAPIARAGPVIAYRAVSALPPAYLQTSSGLVAPRFFATQPSRVYFATRGEGGLAVVTQNDAPGWRVMVDGVERPKTLTEHGFRAVAVPPGDHALVWIYRPLSLRAGAAVSIVTLLMALGFALRARRT